MKARLLLSGANPTGSFGEPGWLPHSHASQASGMPSASASGHAVSTGVVSPPADESTGVESLPGDASVPALLPPRGNVKLHAVSRATVATAADLIHSNVTSCKPPR